MGEYTNPRSYNYISWGTIIVVIVLTVFMVIQYYPNRKIDMVKAIEWENGKVIMLDQTKLPLEVAFIECGDYMKVAEGIKKLWIRGAPAIGIAAAMGIALGAQEIKAENFEEFMKALEPVFQRCLPQGRQQSIYNGLWTGLKNY